MGGTGLYFKSLTDGLVKIPNVPIKVRNEIRFLQKKLGQKKFYQKNLKKEFRNLKQEYLGFQKKNLILAQQNNWVK